MGVIYKATNIINGKSYIGQTKFSLENRKKGHLYDAQRYNTYFGNALLKYGIENFIWEILFECKEQRHLDAFERIFIQIHNTFEEGYNLTNGGEGGYERSDKTKNIIREKAKKRMKGKNNPFYGKSHNEKN